MSLEPIVFSEEETELKSIPVTVGKINYVLLEPDADAVAKYESAKHGSLRVNADTGKPERLEGLGDVKPLLVSLCLYTVDDKGQPAKRVHEANIRKWKSPIINRLYDAAREMGGLEDVLPLEGMRKERDRLDREIKRIEAEQAKVGNLPGSTADTSE